MMAASNYNTLLTNVDVSKLVLQPNRLQALKFSEPQTTENIDMLCIAPVLDSVQDGRSETSHTEEASSSDLAPGTPLAPMTDFSPFVAATETDERRLLDNLITSAITFPSSESFSPFAPAVPSVALPSDPGFCDPEPETQVKKKSCVSSRVRYRGLYFSATEPSILAEKYIVFGLVDASTAFATDIRTHENYHIKLVTSKAASEVGAQQALLQDDVGIRSPVEIIRAPNGQKSWLVFPPHKGDLHSYVRSRKRLREAETQRLFSQIATTVCKCHRVGLILRDLKLRKFVFTDSSREEVVLESLEDSVLAGDSDLLHDKHGCPAYVAPEILTSSSYSGKHADMWGLGVILYTMLIGKYPFHNSDTSALFAKIRHGRYTLPEWVSSRARHLIMGLLRKKPSLRLTAEEVLDHPWLTRAPRDHSSKDMHEHVVPVIASFPVAKSCKTLKKF